MTEIIDADSSVDYRTVAPTSETMGTVNEPGPSRIAGWELYERPGVRQDPCAEVTFWLEGMPLRLARAAGAIAFLEPGQITPQTQHTAVAFGPPPRPSDDLGYYRLRRMVPEV